ncbi:L,D-transpeptidase family protein [Microbulbifer sp. OS29]|uniref:L,D-transpeptidase family protein n=1 Tax=Microbulbifer okhotskensis TaxID=2926617 RepID=A0A9X2EN74_9GAMM|nr:L,D-transpeptidase family protein [Microbulbifer okhotskensis]MCO1334794.1 L,D-transpeptidase family protein [Microbulbifer okhotskensis]
MRYIATALFMLSSFAYADATLVQVIKSENQMQLLDGNTIIKSYHVAFGGQPKGHKQQEGDEKTPEGHYTLDYKKEDSSFYQYSGQL